MSPSPSPSPRLDNERKIRSPRGSSLTAKSWQTEAAMRMLMNNLDPEVAERPQDLVVYGGRGKAARNWPCFDAIIATLRRLASDETLLVQSGKPVGVVRTHADAPRVLLANSNLVPKWATQEIFDDFERRGLRFGFRWFAVVTELKYSQPMMPPNRGYLRSSAATQRARSSSATQPAPLAGFVTSPITIFSSGQPRRMMSSNPSVRAMSPHPQ